MRDNDMLRLMAWMGTMIVLIAIVTFGFFAVGARASIDTVWMAATAALGSDSSDACPDSVRLVIRYDNSSSRDTVWGTPENNDSLAWWFAVLPTNFQPDVTPAGYFEWLFGSAIERDEPKTIPWSIGGGVSGALVLDSIRVSHGVVVDSGLQITGRAGQVAFDVNASGTGSAHAVNFTGAGDGAGLKLEGAGAGEGMQALGGASGYGVQAASYDADSAGFVGGIDTLLSDVGATATINYDSIDTYLTASHGAGSWTGTAGGTGTESVRIMVIDTVGVDATVDFAAVYVYGTDRETLHAYGITGTAGFVAGDFSLDTGTYMLTLGLPAGTFRDTSWTLYHVGAGPIIDTAFVWSFIPTPPSGSDSCTVVIYTDQPYAEAEFKIDQPSSAPLRDTSGVFLYKGIVKKQADSLGVIQRALVRRNSTAPKCTYDILVRTTGGVELAHWSKYPVPDSTTATLLAID